MKYYRVYEDGNFIAMIIADKYKKLDSSCWHQHWFIKDGQTVAVFPERFEVRSDIGGLSL